MCFPPPRFNNTTRALRAHVYIALARYTKIGVVQITFDRLTKFGAAVASTACHRGRHRVGKLFTGNPKHTGVSSLHLATLTVAKHSLSDAVLIFPALNEEMYMRNMHMRVRRNSRLQKRLLSRRFRSLSAGIAARIVPSRRFAKRRL